MKLCHYYGIIGIAFNWTVSYSSNRMQFTSFNNVDSNQLNIVCGIRQGFTLRPLLCNIYVNDVHLVSENCFTILFAVDTIIFLTVRNSTTMNDIICCKLSQFYSWFSADKLYLNMSKTN